MKPSRPQFLAGIFAIQASAGCVAFEDLHNEPALLTLSPQECAAAERDVHGVVSPAIRYDRNAAWIS